MRTIIAGSRDCTQASVISDAVEACPWRVTEVVSGTARGVDTLGENWADTCGIQVWRFPADWNQHGNRAGYIRNKEMAEFSKALIAIWDGESNGTKHMIDIARTHRLKVFVWDYKKGREYMPDRSTNLGTVITCIDFETFLISEFNTPNPQPICMSYCTGDEEGNITHTGLFGTEEFDVLKLTLLEILRDHDVVIMQNAKFDALCAYFNMDNEIKAAIWKAYNEGRIHDTIIREKLINLTMYGAIDIIELMDGVNKKIFYDLGSLEQHYLGLDRSDQKSGDNVWRTNYSLLVGKPVDEWPENAVNYTIDDAKGAYRVYLAQEERRADVKDIVLHDPFEVEEFRTMSDFCLGFMTYFGNKVDQATLAIVKDEFEDLYNDERLVNPLMDAGIVIPAIPSEPCKNRQRIHGEGCTGHKDHPEYKASKKVDCDCPLKMKQAVPEKESRLTLQAYVKALCESDDRYTLKYTPKSIENEKDKAEEEGRKVNPDNFTVQVNADWMEEFAPLDPLLTLYFERKQYQKMITTYIPAMFREDGKTPAETIRAPFDVLKVTGRTSSFADKLYPSTNGQNADPRIRKCYIPREGYCLFSIDYAGMELGTFAQECYNLFGYSVLADKINAGIKPHAYLGASIAYATDTAFERMCEDFHEDRNLIYELFSSFRELNAPCDSKDFIRTFQKEHPDEMPTWIDFYAHYYKFAKPTGLGFPGGLGPKTFVTYAKGTFGVDLDQSTAVDLRDIWKDTYPEAAEYLKWINKHGVTDRFPAKSITKNGNTFESQSFAYTTPMGLHRGRCDYCACANGKGLQSPGAEGALRAVNWITREIYEPSTSIIANTTRQWIRPTLFIHDEIFGEVWLDDMTTARIDRMGEIMVKAMEVTTPNVKAAVEPALMMVWNKKAEEVRDDKGNLKIWYPKED